MAYIYQITNNINGKIYIGKTERSIQERWQEHCNDCKKDRYKNKPLYRAMKKYGIENFSIECLEKTDNPEEREIYWIEQKGSFKYGYNATLGGDGKRYIDYDLIETTYNKVRCQKDVATILGISEDTVRMVLKQRNIKIKTSSEIQRERKGKIVSMYSLDDTYLRTFSTIADAATFMVEQKLTGCKHSTIRTHISEVCRGKRITAAGYKWKFN